MEAFIKHFISTHSQTEFSEFYDTHLKNNLHCEETSVHIHESQWNISEAACFLNAHEDSDLVQVASLARQVSRQRFGHAVQLFAPLYLSNECDSICVYCGFSKNRTISRLTLSIDQMAQNFSILKKQGFDHVLLLTGESPHKTPLSYLEKAVKLAKEYFTQVSLEIYPLSVDDYALLVCAGATGLVIYQETYDYDVYKKMHLSGEKKDFYYRLNAPERALKAGFRRIGLGALLGLSEAVSDVVKLSSHVYYLKHKYWKAEYTLSFPRINPEGLLSKVPKVVGERMLIAIIAAMRLVFHDVGFVLSTREKPEFRDRLLELGMTHLSAGSKTNPGGYAGETSGEQFSIRDGRSLQEVEHMLKMNGMDPVRKDWEKEFEGIRS